MTLLVIQLPLVSSAFAANELEVSFERYRDGGGSYLHDILLGANKNGAVTCTLTTTIAVYGCVFMGEFWYPEEPFWEDHADLSFTELTTAISGRWILTWDSGQLTETVASIGFGNVPEGDFPEVPTLVEPADGSISVNPDPNPLTIQWTYGTGVDPLDAQPDAVEVTLAGPGDMTFSSGELPRTALAWTPPVALAAGDWTVEVQNIITDYRLVADGIGGPIEGDPWILENEDWLSLESVVGAQWEVVPNHNRTFGEVKALYR
jgi:hypothetical protein